MKKRGKKAQVSVEFSLLLGLVTLLLLAIIGIAYYYSGSAKAQIRVNTIEKAGKKIADTADSICFLGAPSKATIQVNIPEGVEEVKVQSNGIHGVLFKVKIRGNVVTDLFYKTQCPILIDDQTLVGLKKQGTKTIVVIAEENKVRITRT
ncbi:MAG: hypothetical protein NZ889_02140 [Candidatus Pacearchaeota archaeon]|nr:hypothetical protein [Candidatus Pacearchaeota archaeon]